jgi:hypothetical protein
MESSWTVCLSIQTFVTSSIGAAASLYPRCTSSPDAAPITSSSVISIRERTSSPMGRSVRTAHRQRTYSPVSWEVRYPITVIKDGEALTWVGAGCAGGSGDTRFRSSIRAPHPAWRGGSGR